MNPFNFKTIAASFLAVSCVGAFATNAFAHGGHADSHATSHRTLVATPFVCTDEGGTASARFVNVNSGHGRALVLRAVVGNEGLNLAGANVNAFGLPFNSVGFDTNVCTDSGEDPEIDVFGEDPFGMTVGAFYFCGYPTSETNLRNGFVRKFFLPSASHDGQAPTTLSNVVFFIYSLDDVLKADFTNFKVNNTLAHYDLHRLQGCEVFQEIEEGAVQ